MNHAIIVTTYEKLSKNKKWHGKVKHLFGFGGI